MNFEQIKKNIQSLITSSKIIENFPDMIIYIDSEGDIKAANKKAADFFGITDSSSIKEIIKNAKNVVKEALKSQKAILVERKAAQKEYLELSASKVEDDYCLSIRNNTELINETLKKEGIERFNNDKNVMLVELENEIKSPINSITGFSKGLTDGIGGEVTPKQEKYLNIILKNAGDLKEFTNKFLDFSYAESLLYEPEIKKIDAISEIKDVLKDYEGLMKLENVVSEFDYSSLESRNITTDAKAFKKILENILEVSLSLTKNGKIYMRLAYPDEENFITYGLDENKKYLQLTIKDTGSSISKEDMEHICNPYTKTSKGRKIFVRSLRLGIASILTNRSEGFFAFNSESGQGNFYSVILPDMQ